MLGRAETARLILAYAGVEYEDKRITFGKYFVPCVPTLIPPVRGDARAEAEPSIRAGAGAGVPGHHPLPVHGHRKVGIIIIVMWLIQMRHVKITPNHLTHNSP